MKRQMALRLIRERLAVCGRERLKAPNLNNKQHEDEVLPLKWKHGVRMFPPKRKFFKKTDFCSTEEETCRPILWLAVVEGIKIVREKSHATAFLKNHAVKHTNISGGRKAFVGGEMLFNNENKLVINFASGRYGPTSREEFTFWSEAVCKILYYIGYRPRLIGWDDEVRRPGRFQR